MKSSATRGHPSMDGAVDDGWVLQRMSGRWMVLAIVAAILVVGLGLTAALFQKSLADADRDEKDLAVRASRVLQASSGALVAALGGAQAVVGRDGIVDLNDFRTFAANAVDTTEIAALAFVPVVTGDQRAEFEAEAGLIIMQLGPDGLIRSGVRSEYLPVQVVYPVTDVTRGVIGFDTASDPTRLATMNAARDLARLAYSGPVPAQPTGETSVFFAAPLFRPGAEVGDVLQRREAIIGYLSGLIRSSTLLASIVDQLPDGTRLSITDADELIASTPAIPSDGHSVVVELGGRTWTITVSHGSAYLGTSLLMLIATLVLAAAVGYSLIRTARKTRELRFAAMNVRQLGRLTERLAVATDRQQMIHTILERATSLVGSMSATVAMWSGSDTLLATSGVRREGRTTVADPEDVPIDGSSPIGKALLTDAAVYVQDGTALRAGFAGVASRWSQAGLEACAALPIRRPNGEQMGVIELAWSRPNRFGESLRSTLLTMAEVCQQSLYRAEVQETRWRAASHLSELGQRLSVSRTLDDIARAVVRHAAQASGADHVAVGFVNDACTELKVFHSSFDRDAFGDGPPSFEFPLHPSGELMSVLKRGQPIRFDGAADLERFPAVRHLVGDRLKRIECMPLIDAGNQLRGVVAFVYLSGSDLRLSPEAGRLDTIAGLTAQTVERSLLYQHEHELVVNLQRQTLAELPTIDGLRVAARYLPASSLLGLGGDWYDVHILKDGRIGVVVGDVAGHGIDAIADMAEFRTTIATLLRTNLDLARLPLLSTALLNDDGHSELRFATAGLMIVDVAGRQLSYIRAGHPPSMVRTPNHDVIILEAGGGAPIGIATSSVVQNELALPSGSVIIAYTDGLIERRDESIDVGLARLAAAVRECDSDDPDVIADAAIARCLGGRETEDDTALLVVVVE